MTMTATPRRSGPRLGSPRAYAILAGGGTVGHVAPAIGVAHALVERGHDKASIHFVGSQRGMEAELVPAAGFPLTTLPGRGIVRRLSAANLRAAAGIVLATLRAIGLVRRLRPGVVVNLGGYASVPCTLAAALLRVPIVVVSYDAVPGSASRLAGRFAKASAVAVPASPLPRAVLTGAPVRPEVLALDTSPAGREAARAELAVPTGSRLVVVTSGSLGARRVNRAAVGLARLWVDRPDIVLYQTVGKRDFVEIEAAAAEIPPGRLDYRRVEFEARLPLLLAAADVVVGRAGASTVAELVVIGAASILVPLPGAPSDHQTRNAEALASAGAAVMLPDADCTPERLGELLDELLADPERRASMRRAAAGLGRRDATERIAELIEQHRRRSR
jgi:UDP-N-acetylglucosamine--N-acetylmuramyl-(pentapeptide) pyrophosphoryl-undecaprenol N-acetylglucosamine transferase